MNSIATWAILLIAKNQSSDSGRRVRAVKYNFSYKGSRKQRFRETVTNSWLPSVLLRFIGQGHTDLFYTHQIDARKHLAVPSVDMNDTTLYYTERISFWPLYHVFQLTIYKIVQYFIKLLCSHFLSY